MKYLLALFALLLLLSCKENFQQNDKVLKELSREEINLKLQEFIVSNVSSLVSSKTSDCENVGSDITAANDFDFSTCFQITQKRDNEFQRFKIEDKITASNFELVQWIPSFDEEDYKTLFHNIDYWILNNTLIKGDLNNDNSVDYAIKVFKKPSGFAKALWITEWYFIISEGQSYVVETKDLFNSTYRELGYEVKEIKEDTVIGNFQYYSSHLLPYNTNSIVDSTNLLIHKHSNNEVSFSKKDFYVIPYMTMKLESKAVEIKSYLSKNKIISDYLYLMDYRSLNSEDEYLVYIGPFSTKAMCELALIELRKEVGFENSYGILVSKDKARTVVGIK